MNFDTAFDAVIGHEGGYVWHKDDPGGETRYGISKRAYPGEDIKNLTVERAKELYHRDYWTAIKGDSMPFPIAFEVFDSAVNHGVGQAVRFLQKALGVSADGMIGPVTIATAQAVNPDRFRMKFNAERLDFYTDLSAWPAFGRGWVKRVANNLRRI